MRTIDTNVVVRLILEDDAVQLQIAQRLIGEPFLILPTVVLETVWVLHSQNGMSRGRVVSDLREVLGHVNATVQAANVIGWALDRFEDGADFADAMHIGFAAAADASNFATFDRKLGRKIKAPDLQIETLT